MHAVKCRAHGKRSTDPGERASRRSGRSRGRGRASRRQSLPKSQACATSTTRRCQASGASVRSNRVPVRRPRRAAACTIGAELQRIRSLVIPPAWTDVWICPQPARPPAGDRPRRARPQAVSLSPALARGARRGEVRPPDRVRARRCRASARAPTADLRKQRAAAREGARRRRPAAREDADPRRQRGVRARQPLVRLDDDARSAREDRGRDGALRVPRQERHRSTPSICTTRRLARIVKACRDLPGYELFQYVDDDGTRQVIDSADVNAYLREITGEDFTAKDFRTWAGTVLAAKALAEVARRSRRTRKQNATIASAMESVCETAGQHQSGLPEVLHPSRRFSTRTWTARRSARLGLMPRERSRVGAC